MYGYYQPPFQPRQEVIRVNGEPGARSYQLPPNSSALLLDDTAPTVWLIQTDGAGYKTVTPFAITQATPADPIKTLEERIKKLEEKINEPDSKHDDGQ